ncbi:MAG: HD domain-containing phosphohydrolase [Acidobacteriota bacterium]
MQNPAAAPSRFDEKLLDLSTSIDQFEGYAYAHALSIALIADAVAKQFNLAPHDRFFMQQAALVHDIGEMIMARDYIKAHRRLTDDERIDLQRHPVIGEQETARRGFSRGVQLLVRWHHEWWNGSGYPDAIESSQIPLAARILRLADSYSSITVDRPWRPAMGAIEAKQFLIDWAGIEFDPEVVRAFLSVDESVYSPSAPVEAEAIQTEHEAR